MPKKLIRCNAYEQTFELVYLLLSNTHAWNETLICKENYSNIYLRAYIWPVHLYWILMYNRHFKRTQIPVYQPPCIRRIHYPEIQSFHMIRLQHAAYTFYRWNHMGHIPISIVDMYPFFLQTYIFMKILVNKWYREVWPICHWRLGHETMVMRCMSFYVLMIYYAIQHTVDPT